MFQVEEAEWLPALERPVSSRHMMSFLRCIDVSPTSFRRHVPLGPFVLACMVFVNCYQFRCFGFDGRIWGLIVIFPDRCQSCYFA